MAIKYITLLTNILEWQQKQELLDESIDRSTNAIDMIKSEYTEKQPYSEIVPIKRTHLNETSSNRLLMIAPSMKHQMDTQRPIKAEIVTTDELRMGHEHRSRNPQVANINRTGILPEPNNNNNAFVGGANSSAFYPQQKQAHSLSIKVDLSSSSMNAIGAEKCNGANNESHSRASKYFENKNISRNVVKCVKNSNVANGKRKTINSGKYCSAIEKKKKEK